MSASRNPGATGADNATVGTAGSAEDGASCREAVCPCMEPCPMKRAMSVLGGKWKLPILCALHFDGPLRYNELGRRVKGISNTMLAGSLKELERDGLVRRTQYPEMPVRVEYAATEACEQLVPAFEIIGAWSRESLPSR